MGKRAIEFGEAEQDPPKQSMKGTGLSGWGKVGLITGGGMALFFFATFMYMNSTGILPAANRLSSARAKYIASGAPQTIADVEKIYAVPDDLNAALILDYLSGTKGTRTRIEFPLAGKKGGERFSVSWKQFVADVDRAAGRPHFRPNRDFSNPYSILLPEFSFFRGAMSEFFRQAEASIEKGDFAEAEKHVARACLIDGWSTDQPCLIAKIVRINGVSDNLRFVGILASLPPGHQEVSKIIGRLKAAAQRPVQVADVAAMEAFSLSRVGEVLSEPGNSDMYSMYSASSLSGGTGGSPLAKLEDRAFEYAARSSFGNAAVSSHSLEVAFAYYDSWKRSKDLDKAFAEGSQALLKSGDTRLVKVMANILPMVTGSGVNDIIDVRPNIHAQILDIASWIYRQKSSERIKLDTLKAEDLPGPLRYDILGNPIVFVKSGNELRIYSYGVDKADDGGGSKDTGFSIRLGSR